jgi:hypothetical protein
LKTTVFLGESSEWIVQNFRFLDDHDQFMGGKWVAKQSRFLEEHEGTLDARMIYHKEFMRTQVLAHAFAQRGFNEKLNKLEASFSP